MIKRVVEISSAAKLSMSRSQLKVEKEDSAEQRFPIEDLGMLILDHPAIRPSQRLLSECVKNNVSIVLCDEKHLPSSILLPMEGHTQSSRILKAQSAARPFLKQKLWKKIVSCKILAQADVLDFFGEEGKTLRAIADRIDNENATTSEARAARMYWPLLFDEDFRRDRVSGGRNHCLNYGYAIMRAAIARALTGAGMHPAFGVQHQNQYNAFCFADDLMEPCRPFVDFAVRHLDLEAVSYGDELVLEQEEKRSLLEVLSVDVTFNDKTYPLMTALHYYAAGVREFLLEETNDFQVPTR